jgi:hypothetical protein
MNLTADAVAKNAQVLNPKASGGGPNRPAKRGLCGRVSNARSTLIKDANARSNAASSLSKCLPDVGGGTPVKTLPENRRAANLPSLDREGCHEAARVHRGA